jgi:microcin C transport system substrate-binding protein
MFLPVRTGAYTTINLTLFILLTTTATHTQALAVTHMQLPAIQWETSNSPNNWGDPQATAGGTLNLPLLTAPSTLRRSGPGTPEPATHILNDLQLPLMWHNPASNDWIPLLASHWHMDKSHHRIYFRLDKDARWSDGVTVTTRDIEFTLSFFDNPANQTPWQRQEINEHLIGIEVFSATDFALHSRQPLSPAQIDKLIDFRPMAAHFFTNDLRWPGQFNWRPEPTTGPYVISDIAEGEQLTLSRLEDWWGNAHWQFHKRFNVSKVIYQTRHSNRSYIEAFTQGDMDALPVNNDHNLESVTARQLINSARIRQIESLRPGTIKESTPQKSTDQKSIITDPTRNITRGLLINRKALQTATDNPVKVWYNNPAADDNIKSALAKQPNLPATRLQLTTRAQLIKRLKHAQFALAWIEIQPAPDDINEWIKTTLQDNSSTNTEDWEFQAQPSTPSRHRYLTWNWVQTPASPAAIPDPLDPLNATTGGLFWIDREIRTDTLSGDKPQPETEAIHADANSEPAAEGDQVQ